MRRDYFTLRTRLPEESAATETPTIEVAYDGPAEDLRDALTDDAGDPLPAAAIDVTCRLLDEDSDASCVVALTHRLTGEFLLEANAAAGALIDLVEAARSADDASYSVRVTTEDGQEYAYDLDVLLVYDDAGGLLRHQSLIPSGVEL